jgi:hypothetical protein
MVSCVGLESLESYKSFKFGAWRDNMFEAFHGCAKAFLPELKRQKVMTNVYDTSVFPMSPIERSQWEVDHNGKMISIPRPVKALRIFNSSTQAYDDINPMMDGAPTEAEQGSYWVSFLDELRAHLGPKYGEEFVDDCLRLTPQEIKDKYF